MQKEILRIEDLHLEVSGREVLKGLNLLILENEKTLLFGPNGAGKSSLIYAILGFPNYIIKAGKILFRGTDIADLSTNERVKLGIGVAFQNPPAIRGIKLKEMLSICDKEIKPEEIEKVSSVMNMKDFLERDVNLGFSGGEAKRAELLQILAQKPDFTLFDEPDSGVDIENVELIGKQIDSFLTSRSGIIITHQGYILQFIKATRACVLYDGEIVCGGDPHKILNDIKEKGYAGCALCRKKEI